MEIRLATVRDAQAVTAMAIAFRDHLGRAAPTDAQFAASVRQLFASGDAQFCIASADGVATDRIRARYRA